MTLYIGELLGGPELSASPGVSALDEIRNAALGLRDQGRSLGDQGSLDLVFHFPGTIFQPEFSGIRTAKFSRKQKMLMIQIAVPPRIIHVAEHRFFLDSLRAAVGLAAPVFARAGIPFRADDYLAFIQDVELLTDSVDHGTTQ